jgi:predicted P-loop ATPase
MSTPEILPPRPSVPPVQVLNMFQRPLTPVTRPTPADLSLIPVIIRESNRLVLWDYRNDRNGKPTKVPFQPHHPRLHAKVNDPTTWGTFDQAVTGMNGHAGIGCVVPPGIVFIDWDHILVNGALPIWIQRILEQIRSYAEASPSGTGLHQIIMGALPGPGNKVGCLEMYDASRYLTFTGNHLLVSPLTVEPVNVDQLHRLMVARVFDFTRNPKLEKLLNGDHSEYPSPSEADLALCSLLASLRLSPEDIDYVFRLSGLFDEKWERADYREATIGKALAPDTRPSGRAIILGSDGDWQNALLRNAPTKEQRECGLPGTSKALLHNAALMLRHDPAWQGVLAYNEFSLQVETALPAPWPQSRPGTIWDEDADSRTACWLQAHGVTVNSKVAGEAVQVIAREHPFHPVKRELESTVWDQQPRIMSLLPTYLGAEDSPLNAVMGAKYLIQSIGRTYEPGCQADATLLLIGRQGIGKGTALWTLAGDKYFTDHLSDMASKDARLELHGKRIIEIGEFANRRSELERKGFLTCRADNFRPPYERRSRWVPRSCVFAATSNDTNPLTDETGGRRYWSVTCGKIDIEALRHDRDQLWAEALVQYRAGETWHVDFEEFGAALTKEQESRYRGGAYDELILPWLENPKPRDYDIHIDHLFETEQGNRVLRFDSNPALVATHCRCAEPARLTVLDIWVHAIGRGAHEISDKANAAIRACLVHAGWRFEKIRQVPGTRRTARFYVKESQ